jgi:Nucleotide-diphospho-sugar transferase
MGSQKPQAVVKLFDTIQAQTVALVDTDTIWMRDPFHWLDQHPAADMFVTTDCLSHEAEVAKHVVPRCGHVPGGTGGGMALNTGAHERNCPAAGPCTCSWSMLIAGRAVCGDNACEQQQRWALAAGVTIWRNTPGSRAFAAAWQRQMSDNALHAAGVDDQLSFNRLMFFEATADGGFAAKRFPLVRAAGDERVFAAGPGDMVQLMVLPSAVFAGAHAARATEAPRVPASCRLCTMRAREFASRMASRHTVPEC